MLKLIVRKLVQGILMLGVVSAISFGLLSSAGGDAFAALRENPQVSEETIERLRQIYGLDRPLPVRYASWVGGMVHGEMGDSITFRTSVGRLIFDRLLNTLKIGVLGLLLAILVSALLTFVSLTIRGKFVERVIGGIVLVTSAMPRIVLALFVLAVTVSLSGSVAAIREGSTASLFLASMVIGSPLIALFLSQMHAEMKHAMAEPFVQFARAKGLSETAIIFRHASRAALNPLLTILGVSLGAVIGGSVIVEVVLGWPGIGSLMVTAVRSRDVPLVMGIVVVTSIAVWLANSIAELLQLVNDKRLREAEADR